MTSSEFNKKYEKWIPQGWYGLEFNIPDVTEYLDSIMDGGLVELPGFELHQIKLKFGMSRFYFGSSITNKKVEGMIEREIESTIDEIIKKLSK